MNFESKRRVTIRDLALAAGVSVATASRAMANHPHHSLETRTRIQNLALEIGYVRHPLVAALMTNIRCNRKQDTDTVIALVHGGRKGRLLEPELAEFRLGILERAVDLGYRADDFYIGEEGMTLSRVLSIMKARGVGGMVLEHCDLGEVRTAELDFSEIACVAVECRMEGVCLHSVDIDRFRGVSLAFLKARERGYRRVGLVTHEISEAIGDYKRSASFARLVSELPESERVESLRLGGSGERSEANFERLDSWLAGGAVDAVLSPIDWVGERVIGLGIGFAHLALLDAPGWGFSGIDPHWRGLGALAIDRLADSLERNRRGAPLHAVSSFLSCSWSEGRGTLPVLGAVGSTLSSWIG